MIWNRLARQEANKYFVTVLTHDNFKMKIYLPLFLHMISWVTNSMNIVKKKKKKQTKTKQNKTTKTTKQNENNTTTKQDK